MSDDKPAPVHYNGGQTACGIGTVAATLRTEEVTCPGCIAWIERRRAGLARGPDNGDWGAAAEWPLRYDSEVHPMRGYISVGADGALTPVTVSPAEEAMKALVAALPDPFAEAVAYYNSLPVSEEGAMDPVKPEPPYPFVCTTVDDVAEAFRRSTGVPVAFVTDAPALRVALGSMTEMTGLLRYVEFGDTGYSQDEVWRRCPVCSGVHPGDLGKDAPKDRKRGHHDGCELGAILARLDATKAGT